MAAFDLPAAAFDLLAVAFDLVVAFDLREGAFDLREGACYSMEKVVFVDCLNKREALIIKFMNNSDFLNFL